MSEWVHKWMLVCMDVCVRAYLHGTSSLSVVNNKYCKSHLNYSRFSRRWRLQPSTSSPSPSTMCVNISKQVWFPWLFFFFLYFQCWFSGVILAYLRTHPGSSRMWQIACSCASLAYLCRAEIRGWKKKCVVNIYRRWWKATRKIIIIKVAPPACGESSFHRG